jgi:hypothetical protein
MASAASVGPESNPRVKTTSHLFTAHLLVRSRNDIALSLYTAGMPKKVTKDSKTQASRLLDAAKAARNDGTRSPFSQAMGKNTLEKQSRKATRVG